MFTTTNRPFAALARGLDHAARRTPGFAVGGAWFFIAFSLAHLVWVIGVKWAGPAGLTTLYQTTIQAAGGAETYRAFGLAYDGTAGLLLALVQFAAVGAAAIASTRSSGRACRWGHGTLIAWSGLWMIDLVRLAALDGRLDTTATAALLTALFACTVYRAVRCLRGGRVLHPRLIACVLAPDEVDAAPAEAAEIAGPAGGRITRAAAAARRVAAGARRIAADGQRVAGGGRRGIRSLRDRVRPTLTTARRRVVSWLRAAGVLPTKTA